MRNGSFNLGGGTVTYLHSDHLGSVGATTGAVVSTMEYDPWGAVCSGGATAATRKSFTGQERDDTGLLNYNARLYDSTLGRFISADTIAPDRANPQTRNRYSYVLNNPLRWTDPTGHAACQVSSDSAETTEGCKDYARQVRPYQALLLRFNFLCVFRKLCNPQHTCITRSRISPQCIRIFSATMR